MFRRTSQRWHATRKTNLNTTTDLRRVAIRAIVRLATPKTMKQGQSTASPIPGGAVTITECSNTDSVKLPTLTIMLAAVPPSNDEPAYPAESLALTHRQVGELYAVLTCYYEDKPNTEASHGER